MRGLNVMQVTELDLIGKDTAALGDMLVNQHSQVSNACPPCIHAHTAVLVTLSTHRHIRAYSSARPSQEPCLLRTFTFLDRCANHSSPIARAAYVVVWCRACTAHTG